MVPVTIDGEQVKLATITYKPAGTGPFPTLIFHHGSTGRGNDPSIFARPYDPRTLAQWFTARGWAVVLPSRRGRGGSEGTLRRGLRDRPGAGLRLRGDAVAPRRRSRLARHRRHHAGDPGAALRRSQPRRRRRPCRAAASSPSPGAAASPRVAARGNQLRRRLDGRGLFERKRHQPEPVQSRRRLRPADDLALRRQGPVLSAVAQPREFRGLPGGRRQGNLSRVPAARAA